MLNESITALTAQETFDRLRRITCDFTDPLVRDDPLNRNADLEARLLWHHLDKLSPALAADSRLKALGRQRRALLARFTRRHKVFFLLQSLGFFLAAAGAVLLRSLIPSLLLVLLAYFLCCQSMVHANAVRFEFRPEDPNPWRVWR